MNKEELKRQIKLNSHLEYDKVEGRPASVYVPVVIDLIDQLDEPEKVVVPEFVGEWIEKCKERNWTLVQTDNVLNIENVNIIKWLYHEGDRNEKANLFARAWLFGYTVEEKKYRIKLGNVYFKRAFEFTAWKDKAWVFSEIAEAKEEAEQLGGIVEEVSE